jgi:hypothetical protein
VASGYSYSETAIAVSRIPGAGFPIAEIRANNAPAAGRILLSNNERRPKCAFVDASFRTVIIEYTAHHLSMVE